MKNSSKNKHSVTFTFPSEELLKDFCGYMSDGGGEWGFLDGPAEDEPVRFDYTRCFPAWGWKEGEPRFIDVELLEESPELKALDVELEPNCPYCGDDGYCEECGEDR